MGIILSRIRKKKSTIETLEKLDEDIREIEENRSSAQRKYKKITKLLLAYSLALYILCGVIFYFQYNSPLQGKLFYLVPLAISPLLLYIIQRIVSWYFVRLIKKNLIRLNEMKKEKKRILDEVMDKETYKVAKQILDKFSSETLPKPNLNMQLAPVKQHNEGLRKRIDHASNLLKAQTPGSTFIGFSKMQIPRSTVSQTTAGNRALQVPIHSATPYLPAPVLPLCRSYMDRVVEYLIGDGPNNRYALICSKCHSHNGMALKEEFEYIGFKCCYCFNYNPARKIRPEAPKLESPLRKKQESDSDTDSKASGENSDVEAKHQTILDEKSVSVIPQLVISNMNVGDSNNVESKEKHDEVSSEEENIIGDTVVPENNEHEKNLQNAVEEQSDVNQSKSDANCDQLLRNS